MEEIKKENIILEDGGIVNFKKLKKIVNSGIEKSICKIIFEDEVKEATGFFCDIKEYKLKALITNNHVIDKEFIKNNKKLKIEIEEEEEKEKEINLELKRQIMTDKKLDFTIIEILEDDDIKNYLEIDDDIYSKDYIDETIFACQYPGGDELNYSHGKIKKKINDLYMHSIETLGGSSGSPLLLFNNLKIIGIHKGFIYDKNKNKIYICIPINIIIASIN